MISFRYHLVTLIALFFALAIGIVAGSTVVDQGLIRGLERQRTALERQRADLTDENAGLRAEVSLWEGFGDRLLLPSLDGQLNGLDVTLILPPYTPDTFRVELRSTLRAAGARVDGEVRLGTRLLLTDETAAEQLALALDAGTRRGDELLRAAGTWIGERIGPKLLAELAGTDFERNDFVDVAERRPGGSSRHATVVAWDATVENASLAGSMLTSLLAAAVEADEPVVLAEALKQQPSVATRVRDQDVLRNAISTVDHAGTTLGAVALAVAIAEVTETPVRIHHFGTLPGAEAVLPRNAFQSNAGPAPAPSPAPTTAPTTTGSRRPSAGPRPRTSPSR